MNSDDSLLEVVEIWTDISSTDVAGNYGNVTVFTDTSSDSIPTVELVTFILLVFVTVLGLLGNTTVIFTFAYSRKLRTPQNVFIINLAIADSLLLSTNAPSLHTLIYHHGDRFISDTWCTVTAFLLCWACVTSLLTMAAIAVTRFVSIVYPHHKGRHFTWCKCVSSAVCLWVYAALTLTPLLWGWAKFTYLEPIYLCCFDWTYSMKFNVYLFVVGFGISTITVFFCYGHIYRSVKASKRRIQSLQSGGEARKAAKESKAQGEEVRLAIQLLVIFLLFNVCWLPYLLLAFFIDPAGEADPLMYGIFINLVFVNSAVNPPLYLYYNRQFRSELLRLSRRCKGGGTVNFITQSQFSHSRRPENGDVPQTAKDTCV